MPRANISGICYTFLLKWARDGELKRRNPVEKAALRVSVILKKCSKFEAAPMEGNPDLSSFKVSAKGSPWAKPTGR